MTFSREQRARIAQDVHARTFDGEVIILDLARGEYFGLDAIGASIWDGLAQGQTPDEIATRLQADYDVPPARLLEDILTLASELLRRGLIQTREE
jgi:hypothetical protein